MLLISVSACSDVAPLTPTPTHAFTGPTMAPSPERFTGPPTEGPPSMNGAVGVSDATVAAMPSGGALPPVAASTAEANYQPIEVVMADGTLLHGDLYQQPTRQPGVLLLGPSREGWGDFPLRLNAAGYTVLVMEQREGGDETDVQTMFDALTSGIADPARIGAIGAAEGADWVLRGCAIGQICDTVVLLSPMGDVLDAMARYNPRPLMLVASEEDADSYAVVQALNDAATGDKLLQPFVSAGRGTAMLDNRPDLGGLIVEWLQRQLV